MHASLWLVSALSASVLAAPKFPVFNTNTAIPEGLEALSDYFNLLASKVQQNRHNQEAPACDLSKIQQPTASPPLPPVAAGLHLKHIAIGRGTQNYTCDVTNATAAPVATGAVATLFNASCLASAHRDLFGTLPRASMLFNLTLPSDSSVQHLFPSNLNVSGHHFFNASGVPFFDLDTDPDMQLGRLPCTKNASSPAPADAARGQRGEPAVPWLQLVAAEGATGGLQEVYRLGTVGGSAPATCEGMPANFEVQYSAEYWFYEGKPETEDV